MKLVFIAVNYNNSDITINYIQSILALKRSNKSTIRIVIVDNDSEEKDFKNLHTYIKDVTLNSIKIDLIRNTTNRGYFGGLNTGLKSWGVDQKTYVVIGNNDLAFADDFIFNLLNSTYDNDVMVIAPDVVTRDGIHQNPHCINRVSPIRKFLYKLYYTNYYLGTSIRFPALIYNKIKKPKTLKINQRMYIYMGIGACYILTPRFFEHYSLLDESVFLWGEEALLANQVMKAKGKTLYEPNLTVFHFESASVSRISSKKSWEMQRKSFPMYEKYL